LQHSQNKIKKKKKKKKKKTIKETDYLNAEVKNKLEIKKKAHILQVPP